MDAEWWKPVSERLALVVEQRSFLLSVHGVPEGGRARFLMDVGAFEGRLSEDEYQARASATASGLFLLASGTLPLVVVPASANLL